MIVILFKKLRRVSVSHAKTCHVPRASRETKKEILLFFFSSLMCGRLPAEEDDKERGRKND
jgi:hypothetical protein